MRRTWRVLAAALALTALLAGCGDDDDDDDAAEGGTGTTTTAAPAGEEDGGDDGGDAAASVTIVDFEFQPADITVPVGGSVEVTNDGENTHTFTSDDAGFDAELAAGDSQTVRVNNSTPGEYEFVCTIHSSMTGTITIE